MINLHLHLEDAFIQSNLHFTGGFYHTAKKKKKKNHVPQKKESQVGLEQLEGD